jgi:hypothetical protein
MQHQPSPQHSVSRRFLWFGGLLLSVVFNYFFFFVFFDKIETWMVRSVLEAAVSCIASDFVVHSIRKNKSVLPLVIILSFCVVIAVNYTEFKIHEFNDPNSEKWTALRLFFAPFYVAPTVFGISISMSKLFGRI